MAVVLDMEFTEEDKKLFRARKVIEDELLPRLREYFKQIWNGKRIQGIPATPAWSDSSNDGKALWLKLIPQWKWLDRKMKKKLESGKTIEWDATCLFAAILALNLGKEVSIFHELKKTRNELFHKPQGGISGTDKDMVFSAIGDCYGKLNLPVDGVRNIEKAPITTEELKQLTAQLESEKRKGKPLKVQPVTNLAIVAHFL